MDFVIPFVLWALALPQLLSFPPCACCVRVLEGDLKPLLLFCAAAEPPCPTCGFEPSQCQQLSFGMCPRPFSCPQPPASSAGSSRVLQETEPDTSRKGLVAKALLLPLQLKFISMERSI